MVEVNIKEIVRDKYAEAARRVGAGDRGAAAEQGRLSAIAQGWLLLRR